jgi:hypothetical protein
VLALARQRWLQAAVALALVGCIFPDLDDDDPVLYAQPLPHRDQHSRLGAAPGLDTVRTDTLANREPLEPPVVGSDRWPAPRQETSPEQPELSPERPPPRSRA